MLTYIKIKIMENMRKTFLTKLEDKNNLYFYKDEKKPDNY